MYIKTASNINACCSCEQQKCLLQQQDPFMHIAKERKINIFMRLVCSICIHIAFCCNIHLCCFCCYMHLCFFPLQYAFVLFAIAVCIYFSFFCCNKFMLLTAATCIYVAYCCNIAFMMFAVVIYIHMSYCCNMHLC